MNLRDVFKIVPRPNLEHLRHVAENGIRMEITQAHDMMDMIDFAMQLEVQLKRVRQGLENILEFRKLGDGLRFGALTREELEGVIADIDKALGTANASRETTEANALIAAAPDLLQAVKLARAVAQDELEVLELSFLPEPNEAEANELCEARERLKLFSYAITKAEGTANASPTAEPGPAGGQK